MAIRPYDAADGIRKGESLFAPDRSSIKCWEMGRMMNDGAIIKGEWNDEGWSHHHHGRIVIRPYHLHFLIYNCYICNVKPKKRNLNCICQHQQHIQKQRKRIFIGIC